MLRYVRTYITTDRYVFAAFLLSLIELENQGECVEEVVDAWKGPNMTRSRWR